MNQRRADLGLVLISIVWGSTFTVVHEAVATFPALALVALRFACAAAVFLPALAPVGARQRPQLSWRCVKVGALLGVLLLIGFATQTLGLSYTTPARAGFITGLNVVLVPLLGLGFGQHPPQRALLGVALAVIGLALLSWGCQLPWLGCSATQGAATAQRLGDLLILLCAFAFAMHIVAVSRWAGDLPIVPVNTVQLVVVAALAGALALIFERPIPLPSPTVWGAALFLGLIATALVFALQLALQRHTSATHTALIFALEPVFAALFSWYWTGEALTAAVWLGGGLMLLGVVVAELDLGRPVWRRSRPAMAEEVVLDGAE